MFLFFKGNTHRSTFLEDIKNVKILYRKALFSRNLENLYKIIELLGLNYVFFEEFILCSALYSKNLLLYGTEKNLLDSIKILKDIVRFFPNNLFMFYILDNILLYLRKNTFYNFSGDLHGFIDYIEILIKEISGNFEEYQYQILKNHIIKLKKKQDDYIAYIIIKSIESQILLSLTYAYNVINNSRSSKLIKSFSLMIIIFHYEKMNLKFLRDKYIKILMEEYYPWMIFGYNFD